MHFETLNVCGMSDGVLESKKKKVGGGLFVAGQWDETISDYIFI